MSLIEKVALKPCPFCGEADHLSVSPCGSMTWDMPARPHRVVCHHIDHDEVAGPVAYGKQAAIDAWNNRTTELSAGDGVQECDNLLVIDILKATGQEDDAAYHVLTLTNAAQLAARHRALAVAAERVRIKALEAEVERLRECCHCDDTGTVWSRGRLPRACECRAALGEK